MKSEQSSNYANKSAIRTLLVSSVMENSLDPIIIIISIWNYVISIWILISTTDGTVLLPVFGQWSLALRILGRDVWMLVPSCPTLQVASSISTVKEKYIVI
jgi:hypothetical protein